MWRIAVPSILLLLTLSVSACGDATSPLAITAVKPSLPSDPPFVAAACAEAPPERPVASQRDLGSLIDELAYAHADCRATVAGWRDWWARVKAEAAK